MIYKCCVDYQSDVTMQEPDGKPGCDFMGVNHYAR